MKLDNFFHPQTIAVIGASDNPEKLGFQIFQNLLPTKKVVAVNPSGKKILGKKAIKSLELLTRECVPSSCLLIFAIPAEFVVSEVEIAGKLGFKNIIIISAGFKEAGNIIGENRLIELSLKYQLNILGPNCLGVINNFLGINASFADYETKKVGVGPIFFSQSGAVGSAVLDYAAKENIALGMFVSLGNKAVLNENTFLEYFLKSKELKQCSAFIFYLEEINAGEKFVKLIKSLVRYRPVLILKSGKSDIGAAAAASHTGAISGSYEVFLANMKSCGAIVLDDMAEMFAALKILSRNFNSVDSNLAILSNAGGPLVLATDKATSLGFKLPKLAFKLKDIITHNPLDIIGDARSERYQLALELLLKQKNIGNILIILTPQTITEPEATAKVIISLARKYSRKNIYTAFIGGQKLIAAKQILAAGNVPDFLHAEIALNVLAKLLGTKAEDRRSMIVEAKALDYLASLKLLQKYRIPTAKVISAADYLKKPFCPVVIKAVGPDFLHKSDLGAVKVCNTVLEAHSFIGSLKKKVKGDNYIICQEKVQGLELILGIKIDPQFGPMIMLGSGGIYTEILADFQLIPLDGNIDLAIKALKCYPLLSGARGQKPLDLKGLKQMIERLIKLARENKNISELDINPLFISETKVIAADVRIIYV